MEYQNGLQIGLVMDATRGDNTFYVVDMESGRKINHCGMVWGTGRILSEPSDEGLLTKEHVSDDEDYIMIAVPCKYACRYTKDGVKEETPGGNNG